MLCSKYSNLSAVITTLGISIFLYELLVLGVVIFFLFYYNFYLCLQKISKESMAFYDKVYNTRVRKGF